MEFDFCVLVGNSGPITLDKNPKYDIIVLGSSSGKVIKTVNGGISL